MSAPTRLLFAVVILILFSGNVSMESAERSKDCDSPPGGRITCEDGQAAICKVKDGKVEGSCTTPRKGRTENEVIAQLLSMVLEKEVSATDLDRKEFGYEQMINKGRVRVGGMVVTFSFPDLSAYVEVPERRQPEVKKPPQAAPPVEKPKPSFPKVISRPSPE